MGRPKSSIASKTGDLSASTGAVASLVDAPTTGQLPARGRSNTSSEREPPNLVKYPDFVHAGKLQAWTSLPSNKKLKWKRHYFVLTKSAFLHFEGDKQHTPLQTFPVAGYSADVTTPVADDAKHGHLFSVRKQNTELVLSADSPQALAEWTAAFESAQQAHAAPKQSPRPTIASLRSVSEHPIAGAPFAAAAATAISFSSSTTNNSDTDVVSEVVRATMYKEISESITDDVRKDIDQLFAIIDAEESADSRPAERLADFLLDDRHRGVHALCKAALMSFSDEFLEEFSQKLVKYFADMDKDVDLLRWAITAEVLSAGSSETPFRSTNIYTQLLSSFFYSKSGRSYLFDALSKLVVGIATSKKVLEVDKSRLSRSADIQKNIKRLLQHTNAFLDALFSSVRVCPVGFRQVIKHARDVVSQLNPDMGRLVPGGFLFLRLVCPAIVSPVRWGLTREQPTFEGRRTLLLIAKILQNLANDVEFDGTKEAYMVPCNPFLKEKAKALEAFFSSLLDPESISVAERRQRARLQVDPTAKLAIQTQFLFYLRLKLSTTARKLLSQSSSTSADAATVDAVAPASTVSWSPQTPRAVPDKDDAAAAASTAAVVSPASPPASPKSSPDHQDTTTTSTSTDATSSPPVDSSSSSSSSSSSPSETSSSSSSSSSTAASSSSPQTPRRRPRTREGSRLSHLTSLFAPLGAEPADNDSDISETEPTSANDAEDEEDLWEHQVASAQNYKFFAAKKVKPLKQLWPIDRSWLQATWPPQSAQPASVLVDPSCLACGYSIEWGSDSVAAFDPDHSYRIEDEEMSTSFYSDYLRSRDHVNYIATYMATESDSKTSSSSSSSSVLSSEPDTWTRVAIISVEKGGRRGGGEDLKAIVRYPGYDDRVFVSVPIPRTSSFSFSGDKAMMRPIRRKDHFIKPLMQASPPLAALNLERVENEDLAAELETWELRNVKRAFKFGFLLHLNNQTDEDEMYSNPMTKRAEQFLDWIGTKVKLEGFSSYRGGLDVKKNTTGEYSYFTRLEGYEIMFHVAPLLPFDEKDMQRLEKKRHLGNDVLLVVFSESTDGFLPQNIHSHFNHVFAVVRPVTREGAPTHYEVAFVQKDTVGPYGPFLSSPAVYPKTDEFRQFFLKKLINAERRALEAAVFEQKNKIARRKLIEDMVERFSIASRR